MKFHNHDIDWLLNCASRELGEQSTIGAFIAVMERGGSSTSSEPEWLFDERNVERAGKLLRIWRRLDQQTHTSLLVHYTGVMRVELRAKSPHGDRFARWPQGVEGQLKDPPGVAVWMAHAAGELDGLLKACATPRKEASQHCISHWESASLEEQRRAHDAWSMAARQMSPGARRIREALR